MTVAQETQQIGLRSQSIDRAAQILTCFSAEEPTLTLAQLVAKLGLNQSNVYRYVTSLQSAGLLERNGPRGGYRLGLRVVELAGVALDQIAVRREAIPEMDRLRDDMQLLVNLAVLDSEKGDIIHIAHSAPQGWPPRATTPGRRAVAHCTALGKVLLAYRDLEVVKRAIDQYGWRPYTARSIQDFDRLETNLGEIRERGYSVDDEERSRGTICFGAPIHDHSGEVIAALSVTGTTLKLPPDTHEDILQRLVEAANRISFRLGHTRSLAY